MHRDIERRKDQGLGAQQVQYINVQAGVPVEGRQRVASARGYVDSDDVQWASDGKTLEN
jgi:hypothetical protein